MEEQQQQTYPLAPVEDAPLSAAASQILETLQRARNSEGEARAALATQLNAYLRRKVPVDDREGVGKVLTDMLDDEAFHDLYDSTGTSCRALAVEAVLGLGYPWALHLWPADLEYLRAMKPVRAGSPTLRAMALVTGVLAALFALAFFIHL